MHMAQLMPLPLIVSCFSNIQIGCTFLVPAHPGSSGGRAVKRVCDTCHCLCCIEAGAAAGSLVGLRPDLIHHLLSVCHEAVVGCCDSVVFLVAAVAVVAVHSCRSVVAILP